MGFLSAFFPGICCDLERQRVVYFLFSNFLVSLHTSVPHYFTETYRAFYS